MPKLKLTKNHLQLIGWALIRSSLLEVLFTTTLVLSAYQLNLDFSYPKEIIVPAVMFALLASMVFYGFAWIFRRALPAHIASLPLLYAFFRFRYLQDANDHWLGALLPGSFETEFIRTIVFALLLAVLCGALGYALMRLMGWRRMVALQLPKVLAFFVVFLFISQVGKVCLRLIQMAPELSYSHALTMPAQDASKVGAKPNVYYVVLDRYANNQTLNDIYKYDNSLFTDFLMQQGFVMRSNAYANYPFTMSSVSSTLNMSYHTEFAKKFGDDGFQTAFPYRTILNNPPAAQLFKQNGYTYNQVGSWWDFTRVNIKADNQPTLSYRLHAFGLKFYLSDLERDVVYKSIFSPLLRKGITIGDKHVLAYTEDRNPQEMFEAQITALKDISNKPKTTPQFTFAHILSPHDPYIFNADGSTPSYDSARNDNGVDEKVKYTNQLTYLNTRMQDMFGYIRAHDPDAVIILQADEGPYPKQFRYALTPEHHYNPKDLPDGEKRQKFGILASYYMPGVDSNTVSQNIKASVDPLRFVLSHYLGYQLGPLPDCNFTAGTKYNVYDYTLVTQALTGRPADPRCDSFK
jgi:hypothetical protein